MGPAPAGGASAIVAAASASMGMGMGMGMVVAVAGRVVAGMRNVSRQPQNRRRPVSAPARNSW